MIVRIVLIVPVVSKIVLTIGTIIWKRYPRYRVNFEAIIWKRSQATETIRKIECYPRSHHSYSNMVAENTELNTSLVVEEVQKYPVIYNKFSKEFKTKFIRMNTWKAMERNLGWTRLKKLCSHYCLAFNKPCWRIVSILCQAQVIVKTNCGLLYFLHQSTSALIALLNILRFAPNINIPNAFSIVRPVLDSL